MLRATWRSIATVPSSAQCRSSTSSTTVASAAAGRQEPRDSVEQPQAQLVGFQTRARTATAAASAAATTVRGPRRRASGQAVQVRLDRLANGWNGTAPAPSRHRPDEHVRARAGRHDRQLGEQPGLADAGLAGQERHTAPTRSGVGHVAEEQRDLPVAAEAGHGRRRRPRRGPDGRRRQQRPVLSEDRRLQALRLRSGLNAELVGQHRPKPPVGLERVRLAAVSVQREHELGPPALAQRFARPPASRTPRWPRDGGPSPASPPPGPRPPTRAARRAGQPPCGRTPGRRTRRAPALATARAPRRTGRSRQRGRRPRPARRPCRTSDSAAASVDEPVEQVARRAGDDAVPLQPSSRLRSRRT